MVNPHDYTMNSNPKHLHHNEELLRQLLNGPYSHFKEIGQGDWRDPNQKNPGFSLSIKGYFDHKTNRSGSLLELAKQSKIPLLRHVDRKPKGASPNNIWGNSERIHSKSKGFNLIKSYLTLHRKIPFEAYSDLLELGLIRFNQFKGQQMLVYPSLTPETLEKVIEGKPFEVARIQRIFLNEDGSRKEKKHLGTTEGKSSGFVIPPLKDETDEKCALIVEGFEDALSLRSLIKNIWIVVATDKNGLKKTSGFFENDEPTSYLIIADHDSDVDPSVTGQAEAWRLGEKLKGKGIKRVTVKMPSTPKEDANSALCMGRLPEWLETLIPIPEKYQIEKQEHHKDLKLATLAVAEGDGWPDPEPLIPERKSEAEYPLDALCPTLQNAVEEFIEYTPVPKGLAGSVALAVAGISCQHLANIEIDPQKQYPLNLFFIIEQQSGERKSTVSRAFLNPIIRWESEQKEFGNCLKTQSDLPTRILYEDSTKESLILDLAEGHRSACLWSDESSVFIGGKGMQDNSVLGYLGLFNKTFNGDKIFQSRKQAKSAELDGYRLSCCLMMQEAVLSYLLNLGRGLAEGTGFTTRFLFASPMSIIGTRKYHEAPEKTPAMERFYHKVSTLLNKPVPEDWSKIRRIQLSKSAKKLWIEEHNRVEELCLPGCEFDGFGGIVSKHSERVARIAGVYTIFETSNDLVDETTMRRAINIAQWHLYEAIKIIGSGFIKTKVRDALSLKEWIISWSKDNSKQLTSSIISQFGPHRLRKKSNRDEAIKNLEEHNYIRTKYLGKTTYFEINPKLLSPSATAKVANLG